MSDEGFHLFAKLVIRASRFVQVGASLGRRKIAPFLEDLLHPASVFGFIGFDLGLFTQFPPGTTCSEEARPPVGVFSSPGVATTSISPR